MAKKQKVPELFKSPKDYRETAKRLAPKGEPLIGEVKIWLGECPYEIDTAALDIPAPKRESLKKRYGTVLVLEL